MSSIPVTTFGDAFEFDDISADSLLQDGRFRLALWDLVSKVWRTKFIATQSDYLLVARYPFKQLPYDVNLIIARPIKDIENVPTIESIKVSQNLVNVTYTDGYVCFAKHYQSLREPLFNGVVFDNFMCGTNTYEEYTVGYVEGGQYKLVEK